MKTSSRLFFVLLGTLLWQFCFATDYTFTGNGDWADINNWAGNLMPPSFELPAGSTITVTGTAVLGANCSTTTCQTNNLFVNKGTITIATGGSLTFQNYTQFSHEGALIINGTMINKTHFEIYVGSTITVNGSLINRLWLGNEGTITVNNGGDIDNQLTAIITNCPPLFCLAPIGIIIINNGGTIHNKNSASLDLGNFTNNGGTIDNQSALVGNAVITGSLTNSGTLAPGNSPGTYTITGNYTATATAVHNFEAGGTAATNYDKLNVTGTVNLNGTLNVSLINGFMPSTVHDLPIITGTINGTFTTVNKPASYMVVYTSTSVLLRHTVGLPVKFVSLDAKKEGGAVKVSWVIQNEQHVARYEIEKSVDGSNFKTIGQVNASAVSQYSFTDNSSDVRSFYKIKSVDKDGNYSYSITITYSQGKSTVPLNVFPSPAKGEVTIQHAGASLKSKLTITSIDGRVLQIVHPLEGTQKTTIDVSAVSTGIYIIHYEDGTGASEIVKLIKQ